MHSWVAALNSAKQLKKILNVLVILVDQTIFHHWNIKWSNNETTSWNHSKTFEMKKLNNFRLENMPISQTIISSQLWSIFFIKQYLLICPSHLVCSRAPLVTNRPCHEDVHTIINVVVPFLYLTMILAKNGQIRFTLHLTVFANSDLIEDVIGLQTQNTFLFELDLLIIQRHSIQHGLRTTRKNLLNQKMTMNISMSESPISSYKVKYGIFLQEKRIFH